MSLWPGTDRGKPVAEDGESAQFVTGYSESKGKLLEEQIEQQEALIVQTEANTSIGRTALPHHSTASHGSDKINLQSPDTTTPGQKVHEIRTSGTMNSEQQGDSAVGRRLLMEVEMTAQTATNEHGNMLPDRNSTNKERMKQMAEEVLLNRLKKIKSNMTFQREHTPASAAPVPVAKEHFIQPNVRYCVKPRCVCQSHHLSSAMSKDAYMQATIRNLQIKYKKLEADLTYLLRYISPFGVYEILERQVPVYFGGAPNVEARKPIHKQSSSAPGMRKRKKEDSPRYKIRKLLDKVGSTTGGRQSTKHRSQIYSSFPTSKHLDKPSDQVTASIKVSEAKRKPQRVKAPQNISASPSPSVLLRYTSKPLKRPAFPYKHITRSRAQGRKVKIVSDTSSKDNTAPSSPASFETKVDGVKMISNKPNNMNNVVISKIIRPFTPELTGEVGLPTADWISMSPTSGLTNGTLPIISSYPEEELTASTQFHSTINKYEVLKEKGRAKRMVLKYKSVVSKESIDKKDVCKQLQIKSGAGKDRGVKQVGQIKGEYRLDKLRNIGVAATTMRKTEVDRRGGHSQSRKCRNAADSPTRTVTKTKKSIERSAERKRLPGRILVQGSIENESKHGTGGKKKITAPHKAKKKTFTDGKELKIRGKDKKDEKTSSIIEKLNPYFARVNGKWENDDSIQTAKLMIELPPNKGLYLDSQFTLTDDQDNLPSKIIKEELQKESAVIESLQRDDGLSSQQAESANVEEEETGTSDNISLRDILNSKDFVQRKSAPYLRSHLKYPGLKQAIFQLDKDSNSTVALKDSGGMHADEKKEFSTYSDLNTSKQGITLNDSDLLGSNQSSTSKVPHNSNGSSTLTEEICFSENKKIICHKHINVTEETFDNKANKEIIEGLLGDNANPKALPVHNVSPKYPINCNSPDDYLTLASLPLSENTVTEKDSNESLRDVVNKLLSGNGVNKST